MGSSPSSNWIARTSASSSARSGRMGSARHLKSRCAYACLSRGIPSSMRSYVSSKLVGNSSRKRRITHGKQRRRASSWQTIQRNLHYHVRTIIVWLSNDGLHSISLLRERLDNHFLLFLPPSSHVPI